VFSAQAQELRSQRAILYEALRLVPGITTWESDANMMLVRVPDAQKTFDGMKARRVLVKNVSKMHPLLGNCLRLTVGTADENRQMLAALKESL
jgi:histidinol-phosphate aminotransferase